MWRTKGKARIVRIGATVCELRCRHTTECFIRHWSRVTSVRVGVDPGAKTTGLTVIIDNAVVWSAEISHRGERIKQALEQRRGARSARRCRRKRRTGRAAKPARWKHRTRAPGWLPPSLEHRVEGTLRWIRWILKFATADGAEATFAVEVSAFDVAKLRDPSLEGSAYQRGAVLTRDGAWCLYCGSAERLEIEHVVAKSRGGSDAPHNRVAACHACNHSKVPTSVGFLRGTRGSIAPDTFTYGTATIQPDSLGHPSNGSGNLTFSISRSSGTTPPDGLLGPGLFSLEIGTGPDRKSFAIDNPGTTTSFSFSNHGLNWSAGDTVAVKLVGPLARNAAWGVLLDAPPGAAGLMRARWQAPPDATGVLAYHVRYRTVGRAMGASFRKVGVDARELLLRYLDPGATYEAQICTVTRGERRGPCSLWSTLRLPARSEVPANDFTVSLELPDGSPKATVAWNGTLTYRTRVSGVYDSSVLEFPTSTVGTVATRLGPPGRRIPEFDAYDNTTDSTFSGYRGFARKFIVWDSSNSGYWERTQVVWTYAGANKPHVLELIDKPERFFTNRMNRIGTPSSLCVEITDSSNTVNHPCPDAQIEIEPPVVTSTPAVSEAGSDGQWTEGETVEVTLAFSEAVAVDTANGVPSVAIGLSGPAATRSAGLSARRRNGGARVRLHAGRRRR